LAARVAAGVPLGLTFLATTAGDELTSSSFLVSDTIIAPLL
jgi:hypothetical protein